MPKRAILLLIVVLLLLPTFVVITKLPDIWSKRVPKDFWNNPLNKLKGGNPVALSIGLSGALLMMVVAQVYSVVKRVNRDWTKRLGGPKTWLTIHMVLDFIGPSLVMIHAGLLSNPKFGNATWLMQGLPNFSAGFPAIIAPVAMVSGVFGRYLYRRLPFTKSIFKHWRTFHIVLTAVFYALGLIHVMLNTKGFNQFFGFSED